MAHINNIYDSDKHFAIDPKTRAIVNQSGKTRIIQYDHNSERFTFEIPRYVEGHDMSKCARVEVHFINISTSQNQKSSDVYFCSDLQVSPDDKNVAIFSWIISKNATKYEGSLNFLIRFICLEGTNVSYVLNTAIFTGVQVGAGMDNIANIANDYPDFVATWGEAILETQIDYNVSKQLEPLQKQVDEVDNIDYNELVFNTSELIVADGEAIPVTFLITYSTAYGTAPEPQMGMTAIPTDLPILYVDGYTFAGWYTNSGLTVKAVEGAALTSDVMLYAKWVKNENVQGTYTVNYNINGHGTQPSAANVVTALPNPLPILTEDGYTFGGWYTDSGLTIEAVAGAKITGDVTLYAKWTKIIEETDVLTVYPNEITVKVGETFTLTASMKNLSSYVMWGTTGDRCLNDVSLSGDYNKIKTYKAVATGSVRVKVHLNDNPDMKTECVVTVTE